MRAIFVAYDLLDLDEGRETKPDPKTRENAAIGKAGRKKNA